MTVKADVLANLKQKISPSNLAKRLVGSWKLESSNLYDKNGHCVDDPFSQATGIIIYTGSGQMSVHAMEKSYITQVANNEKPTQGYHGYYGNYTADDKASTVTHSVKGSNHPIKKMAQ